MYNSTGSWYIQSCAAIPIVNFRVFSPPSKEKPCAPYLYHLLCSPPHSSSRQTLVYFQSLRICLSWTFHRNGIIQYVACCGWPLPPSFSTAVILCYMHGPRCVYHLCADGHLGCSHLLAINESCCCEHRRQLSVLAFLLGIQLGLQLPGHR